MQSSPSHQGDPKHHLELVIHYFVMPKLSPNQFTSNSAAFLAPTLVTYVGHFDVIRTRLSSPLYQYGSPLHPLTIQSVPPADDVGKSITYCH